MPINFNSVPVNLRDPGQYIEIASGPLQGLPVMPNNTIMFGQMLASGTATPNVVVQVYSPNQAIQLFGLGSMLARMCQRFLLTNPNTPLFVCPQQDNAEGTAGTGAIVFGGSPTQNGTQPFYVDGPSNLVQTALTVGMSPAEMATAFLAEFEAVTGLPCSAAIDGENTAKVNFTCLHKGLDAGALDLRSLYYTSDAMVPGATITVTSFTGGAANPSLTAAIAALGPQWYLHWDNPYTDGASLAAIYAAQEANWLPTVMKDSISYWSQRLSFGSAATEGEAQNEKLTCYLPGQNIPEAPYLWSTWATGIAANYGLQFRPFTGLSVPGTAAAPAQADQWTSTERNMLNYDGVATYKVDDSGNMQIARLVTTYINNEQGVPDPTFLDVADVIRAAYLRYSLRVFLASTFPRYNIADDGTPITVGSAVTTPSSIAGAIVGLAEQWQNAGLITDLDNFIAGLSVQRNQSDSTRVDILLPITPVKGLYVEAGQIQLQA